VPRCCLFRAAPQHRRCLLRRPQATAADRQESRPWLDEGSWRRFEPPIGRGGEISFRGQPPLVMAEVLAWLQQRCRVSAVKTKEADLRTFCDDLRREQVASISDYVVAARGYEFKGLVAV
jgi:hypothetical protein